jgi:hypothetical protein
LHCSRREAEDKRGMRKAPSEAQHAKSFRQQPTRASRDDRLIVLAERQETRREVSDDRHGNALCDSSHREIQNLRACRSERIAETPSMPTMMSDSANQIDWIAMASVHTTLCTSPLGMPPN